MQSPVTFTKDWTSPFSETWHKVLAEFKDKPGIYGMEIGCFEGRSSIWFLENILTHSNSRLWCIDNFSKGNTAIFGNNIKEKGFADKVIVMEGPSVASLKTIQEYEILDFVYIDGDHTPLGALSDAVLVWDLVKPNGIIIFDDYNLHDQYSHPAIGIDAFLAVIESKYDLLIKADQIIIRKRS